MRVKDRELEESEERHMMEVKVFKQKVMHLLYEQENSIAEIKAENMVALKVITILTPLDGNSCSHIWKTSVHFMQRFVKLFVQFVQRFAKLFVHFVQRFI